MKKALYDEGIFSRYTYNMLVGKRSVFESLRNIDAPNMNEELMLTINAV
jgi:hypothetical protein